MAKRQLDSSIFSRRAPENDRPRDYRLIRTPESGRLMITWMSSDLIGTYTHFWHGRTRPCIGEGCEACRDNSRATWHYYAIAKEDKTSELVIVEMSKAAGDTIADWLKAHRTIRGYRCMLERRGGKRNSRVYARCFEDTCSPSYLADVLPLEPMLLRMWEVRELEMPQLELPAPKLAEISHTEEATG